VVGQTSGQQTLQKLQSCPVKKSIEISTDVIFLGWEDGAADKTYSTAGRHGKYPLHRWVPIDSGQEHQIFPRQVSIKYTTKMVRNRISNDIDLMRLTQYIVPKN